VMRITIKIKKIGWGGPGKQKGKGRRRLHSLLGGPGQPNPANGERASNVIRGKKREYGDSQCNWKVQERGGEARLRG